VKGVHREKLRTPPVLSQQPVLGIKEIPRTGSCEPVECHHCLYVYSIDSPVEGLWFFLTRNFHPASNRDVCCAPSMVWCVNMPGSNP